MEMQLIVLISEASTLIHKISISNGNDTLNLICTKVEANWRFQ